MCICSPTIIALGFACYVIFLNFKGAKLRCQLQGVLNKGAAGRHASGHGYILCKGGPHNILPAFGQVDGAGSSTSATNMFAGICIRPCHDTVLAGFDTIPQQAEEAAEGLD